MKIMKIAIVGYGKMGRMIHELANQQGIEVVSVIDPNAEDATHAEINAQSVKDAEVCVDFSHPETIIDNIQRMSSQGKKMVIGTTGWYEHMDSVKQVVENNKTALVWGGNFSLGVNVFFSLVETAAKLMNNFTAYDPFVFEAHHREKADSPSGTAKMLGDILVDNIERKTSIVDDAFRRKPNNDELHVASLRSGSITGQHQVGFDSAADCIELKHTAKNRQGFALGALQAARWIKDKEGFFSVRDMMKELMG